MSRRITSYNVCYTKLLRGRVTLSGGVSANRVLRENMKKMGEELKVQVFIPPVSLCTDNAAMIAAAGFHRFLKKEFAGPDLNPRAYLSL